MNGKLFKVLRMKEGMTQEEFANHLGISRSLVAGIEQGRQPISDHVRARLVARDYRLDDSFYIFLHKYRQMNIDTQM
jgi:transcriptional regulator with XRE-family HTH domain